VCLICDNVTPKYFWENFIFDKVKG